MIGVIFTGAKSIVFASFIFPLSIMALGQGTRLPPSITYVSRSQYFTDTSQEIILQCQANGSPRPKYKWKHSDEFLQQTKYVSYDEISGNLTISTPTSKVEGLYQCEASNKWGTSVSQPLYLTQAKIGVFEKSSEITFHDVNLGDSLSLPCSDKPSSTPESTYIWHSQSLGSTKTESVTESERMSVDVNGTLQFAFTIPLDNTIDYACGVKNSVLDTIRLGNKKRIRLNIGQPGSTGLVTLLSATDTKDAILETRVTLECIFAGNPAPKVTWTRMQKQLTTDEKYTIESYGRKLTIKNINESDGGLYVCKGSNMKSEGEVSIRVNVVSPPIWAKPLVSQNIIEGSNAYFYCETKNSLNGMNEKRYWYINGKILDQREGKDAADNIKVYGNYLEIEKVSRNRDLMCIQCNVSNSVGSIFKDAFLNVLEPIRILNKPTKSIYFRPGAVLNFSITATTDPSRKLWRKWYFNDQFLSLNQPYFDYNQDTGSLLFDTSHLSFEELSKMSGTYTCRLYHKDQSVNVSIRIFLLKDDTRIPNSDNVSILLASTGEISKFSWVNMSAGFTFFLAISMLLF